MTTSISLKVWADPQKEPDIDIQQIISEGLDRYNESHIGRNPARPIWVVAQNADNRIIGGVKGVVLWSWLLVDWLWVAEEVRGQAVGTQLLSEVERAAAELGCSNAFLNTFTFQAPSFYLNRGYVTFGELENFPAGNSRLWMRKRLER